MPAMRPISLLSDLVNVSVVLDDVSSPSLLAQVITTSKWCPATFKDGYRKKENTEQVTWLAFDIDGQLPITEAVRRLDASGLAYLVGASQNHQRPKNGAGVADRYRVCIPLLEPIRDPAIYETTWRHWAEHLGLPADEAARDVFHSLDKTMELLVPG